MRTKRNAMWLIGCLLLSLVGFGMWAGTTEDAAAWLATTQDAVDGWFPWTPGGPPYSNVQGPSGMGMLQAYVHLGVDSFLASATDNGDYMVEPMWASLSVYSDGDPRFATGDPHFMEVLSQIGGDPQYAEFVQKYFWDKLAGGTYGEANDWDALDFGMAVVSGRSNQGIVELSPWDLAEVAIGAHVAGELATRDAIMDAILAGLEATAAAGGYDVTGLAGAVYASAITGIDLDPLAGVYAGSDSTADLAVALSGMTTTANDGAWLWSSAADPADPTNGDTQNTAWAMMALSAFDHSTYLGQIARGVAFIRSLQQVDGQFLTYPGAGLDSTGSVEVNAEAISGIVFTAPSVVYVDDDFAALSYGDDPAGPGVAIGYDAFAAIAEGIDAVSNSTVNVAAGTFVGAVISRDITLQGDPGGGTIIDDGVHYGGGHPTLETAFLFASGSDGATLRDFVIENDASQQFYFAVFSRGIENVTIERLTVYDTVQGITNWGGSGWSVLDNEIIGTVASGGGGIAILMGATAGYETAADNLVQGNVIGSDASAPDYSCPGIVVTLDLRWDRFDPLATYDVGGNQIIGNTISDGGVVNGVGIEVGVSALWSTATPIEEILAATLGAVHDTLIAENTVSVEDYGIYLYNVTGTDVLRNVIEGCTTVGIGMWDGNDDNVFHYNSIAGNAYGFVNTTGTLADASLNWWGAADGPSDEGPGAGDAVSTDVIYSPWLGIDPDGDPGAAGVQILAPVLIVVDVVGPPPAGGYLNQAIIGSNELPFVDNILVKHGAYEGDEPITDGVNIVSEVGSASHTFINGAVDIRAGNVLLGKLRQGFTFNGPIGVVAGVDASTVHINWNNIYDIVTNGGLNILDATYNFWGDDGPDTVGLVAIHPILPETVGTIIGYIDDLGLSVPQAIDYSYLLEALEHQNRALVALELMETFEFTIEEALELIAEYKWSRVRNALRKSGGDYQEFLLMLIGYGVPAGGGASLLGGGAGADVGPSGLPVFHVGDTVSLVLPLVHPITGEPMEDALVTYTVGRQLEDGTYEIVLFGAMAYDGDLGAFSYELDTTGLVPGLYDIYLGSDDGRNQHLQIEILAE